MILKNPFRYRETDEASERWLARFGEKAKIWRRANTDFSPFSDPIMVFAIPLVSKAMTKDWDVAVSCLQRTLMSLHHQTSNKWLAVICGQDRPEGIAFNDQCRFLPFDKPFEPGRKDNHPKLHAIANYLETIDVGGTYTMGLDADDLVHPDLVSYVTRNNNGHGYSVSQGYMMDEGSGTLARMGARRTPWQRTHPFYIHCGSCTVIRFDTSRSDGGEPFRRKGNHTQHRQNLARFGLNIEPIPFPACIYLVNHGENQRERVGGLRGKINYLARNRIPDRARRDVIADFKLDELFANAPWQAQ